jgi:hypothetical protein
MVKMIDIKTLSFAKMQKENKRQGKQVSLHALFVFTLMEKRCVGMGLSVNCVTFTSQILW